MGNSIQVSITRTEGEWKMIGEKISPNGEDSLRKLSIYIRKEVLKVKNKLITIQEWGILISNKDPKALLV